MNASAKLIKRWGDLDKIRLAPQDLPFVVDAYDDCIADLDEQLGRLLDKLRRRGRAGPDLADRRVGPWREFRRARGSVLPWNEPLSDRAARSAGDRSAWRARDEAGRQGDGEPARPGRDDRRSARSGGGLSVSGDVAGPSLARPPADDQQGSPHDEPALSEVVPGLAINVDAYGLPRKSWPLGALNDGEWSYIRSEGNVHEELFHLSRDGNEQRNLARDPAAWPVLERMRQSLGGAHRRTARCRSDSIVEFPPRDHAPRRDMITSWDIQPAAIAAPIAGCMMIRLNSRTFTCRDQPFSVKTVPYLGAREADWCFVTAREFRLGFPTAA